MASANLQLTQSNCEKDLICASDARSGDTGRVQDMGSYAPEASNSLHVHIRTISDAQISFLLVSPRSLVVRASLTIYSLSIYGWLSSGGLINRIWGPKLSECPLGMERPSLCLPVPQTKHIPRLGNGQTRALSLHLRAMLARLVLTHESKDFCNFSVSMTKASWNFWWISGKITHPKINQLQQQLNFSKDV